MSVNSRLKDTKIIGHRKAFYWHRIPKYSCVSHPKYILATSRNGDRKIMQTIRITSSPTLIIRKWNQFS